MVGTGVETITRKRLYAELVGKPTEIPADTVVLAIGWRPTGSSLLQELKGAATEVVLVGDVDRSGDFVAAIKAGADAGLTV